MPGLDKFQKLYWKDKILMMPQFQMKGRITGMLLCFVICAHSHFIPWLGDSEWLCNFASGTASNKGPVNGKAFDRIIHTQILKYCFIQRLLWFSSNPRGHSLYYCLETVPCLCFLTWIPLSTQPTAAALTATSAENLFARVQLSESTSLLTRSRVLLQRQAGACWCFSPSRRSGFFLYKCWNCWRWI